MEVEGVFVGVVVSWKEGPGLFDSSSDELSELLELNDEVEHEEELEDDLLGYTRGRDICLTGTENVGSVSESSIQSSSALFSDETGPVTCLSDIC